MDGEKFVREMKVSGDFVRQYNVVEKQLIPKREGKKGKDALLFKLVNEKVVIVS